jgi:uncharacterized protein YukE
MPSVRVDAAQVTTLGLRLLDLADELAAQGNPQIDAWAFGPGQSASAFEEVVAQWQLHRLRLCGALAGLGEGAVTAGGLYVDVEETNGRLMIGGDR